MNGAGFQKDFDDDIWGDIVELFSSEQSFDIFQENNYNLQFGVLMASGFRFRYLSEIEKKSYSSLKGEKNQAPTIKVQSSSDVRLQLDLVTESSTLENPFPHFNTFYEVSRFPKSTIKFENGICFINVKKNCPIEIKLDFLGIRKWKLKEAIPRIQHLYPKFNETQARQFYNKNKESVKVRASLIDAEYIVSQIISNTIRSQISKENKEIKIQHISPKIVADNGETLIIVLEKKITSECSTSLIYDDMKTEILSPIYDDGQTYVFRIPPYKVESTAMGKIRIQCCDSYDEKPIRFIQATSEDRKRKSPHYKSDVPLKKPTNDDSPHELYPETGNNDDNIEFDGAYSSMDTGDIIQSTLPDDHISGNDSCKDSGIHSYLSEVGSVDDSSFHESDEESDEIEIEGNQRRKIKQVINLEPINFPPTKRALDSRLEPDRKDQVANKIFSEVARIGHDFAFGKQPTDLFLRIERQLPVVFTLQDDVGDTPLNNAILKGNVEQAERILKTVHSECKWALDLVNTSGHTALILSPACDVPCSFITKLLDAGCRLNMWDDLGKSAITYAIEYQNTDALRVFLDYIQKHNMHSLLQRTDKVYFTPLQVAIMNNYVEGVKMLLSLTDNCGEYMVDVNEVALMNNVTALCMAVEQGASEEIIQLLLNRKDINVNHKKDNNSTVLHTAMKMKRFEVVEILQRHNAEDLFEMDTGEVQESGDEMDEDECVSSSVIIETSPVVEMTQENGPIACNVTNLTTKMESMSLKGDIRSRLIDILLSDEIVFSIKELNTIIKPSFKAILSKFVDIQQNKKEIQDILLRFNCLPNSLGQLFEQLREINRIDLINKVVDQFYC